MKQPVVQLFHTQEVELVFMSGHLKFISDPIYYVTVTTGRLQYANRGTEFIDIIFI